MLKKFTVGLLLLAASSITFAETRVGPAITINFDYRPEDYKRVRVLWIRLDKALRRSGAGELDEPELHADGNDGYFDIRGQDAERLYRIVAPILKSSALMQGAEVTKRSATGQFVFSIQQGR